MTLKRCIAPVLTAGALLGSVVCAPQVLAQASTSSQPINVSANTLSVDDRAGTATYTGAVHVTQGDLTLDSQRLDLYRNNSTGEATRAKATGTSSKRAFLKQDATQSDPEMHGWANTITYQIPQRKMIMQGNAELHRGNDTFHGAYVEYYIDSRRVNANGGGGSSTSGGNQQSTSGGRVNMTITPKSNQQ
ncbi:lipopolysaccharide transport periplasmic protein LptA [Carnimonas nigrificans]|uniref:lipopolysaccharide transport periplasmic protein LptA n=1 Tax=Carnimonas nigrificans TaxID=64323 RepID=UPI0004B64D72|nr:lipopolysaccharide transport periplasmic protein LptA [Carnimonas nigrificans]